MWGMYKWKNNYSQKMQKFAQAHGINSGASLWTVVREMPLILQQPEPAIQLQVYRVEPWVLACITALCLIQAAFMSGVMNSHLALLLVSLYSFVCYLLSNNLLLHAGVLAGNSRS